MGKLACTFCERVTYLGFLHVDGHTLLICQGCAQGWADQIGSLRAEKLSTVLRLAAVTPPGSF